MDTELDNYSTRLHSKCKTKVFNFLTNFLSKISWFLQICKIWLIFGMKGKNMFKLIWAFQIFPHLWTNWSPFETTFKVKWRLFGYYFENGSYNLKFSFFVYNYQSLRSIQKKIIIYQTLKNIQTLHVERPFFINFLMKC